MPSGTRISRITRRCHAAFTELQSQKDASAEIRAWAENQGARLKAWAATLGVHAQGRLSIAYRLQFNEPLATMISQLLDSVESCLRLLTSDRRESGSQVVSLAETEAENSQSLYRFTRISYWSGLLSHGSHNSAPKLDVFESRRRDATSNIGILLDIASDLRKPGTQHEEQRAHKFEPVDGQNRPLLQEFAQCVVESCKMHLIRSRYATTSGDAYLASHGRIETDAQGFDDGNTKSFLHGPDKLLLLLQSGVGAPDQDFIFHRLQVTILQEWRLLCYRAHHARFLAEYHKDIQSGDDSSSSEVGSEFAASPPAKRIKMSQYFPGVSAIYQGQEGKIHDGQDQVITQPTIVPKPESSSATQVSADRKYSKRPPKSSITKMGVTLTNADFPKEVSIQGEEGICSLCYVPMPAEDLKGEHWR